MGTCGSHPPKYTLKDLQDLGLNKTKQASVGCCPRGSGALKYCKKQGFGWPNNGEFDWGGGGDGCSTCSNVSGGYGCSPKCGSGGATVGGKRPRVKRIAYLADTDDCCVLSSDTNPIINGKTCDPKYRGIFKDACQDRLLESCMGAAAFSDGCLAWGNTSENAQRALENYKAHYCNVIDNYNNSTDCQDWCNSTGKGRCDIAVTNFCADPANKYNNPTCSCINSPLDQPQCTATTVDGINVTDRDCQVHGYLTANMQSIIDNAACPTVYNCKQDWGQSGDHNVSRNNYQKMVCGSDYYENKSPVDYTKTIPGTSIKLPDIPGVPKYDFIKGFPNTLILIFIVVVVLILTYKPKSSIKRSSIITDLQPVIKGQKEHHREDYVPVYIV